MLIQMMLFWTTCVLKYPLREDTAKLSFLVCNLPGAINGLMQGKALIDWLNHFLLNDDQDHVQTSSNLSNGIANDVSWSLIMPYLGLMAWHHFNTES